MGEKNSVIDLYIAESKGFSSGKTFSIYPLFQWRFTYMQGLMSPFARANRSRVNEIKYQLYSLISIPHLSFYTLRKEETFFSKSRKREFSQSILIIAESFTFHFRSLLIIIFQKHLSSALNCSLSM